MMTMILNFRKCYSLHFFIATALDAYSYVSSNLREFIPFYGNALGLPLIIMIIDYDDDDNDDSQDFDDDDIMIKHQVYHQFWSSC